MLARLRSWLADKRAQRKEKKARARHWDNRPYVDKNALRYPPESSCPEL